MINLIAAMARNGVIGKGGDLPWNLPEDLKYFGRITSGHPVVMGRKTFESIGRPLPKRKNIILTRNSDYTQEGCSTYTDIESIIRDFADEEVMIIGGAEIYKQFLPYADRIYLTFIDEDFEGDASFPNFIDNTWAMESEEKGMKDSENPYDYYFRVYKKV